MTRSTILAALLLAGCAAQPAVQPPANAAAPAKRKVVGSYVLSDTILRASADLANANIMLGYNSSIVICAPDMEFWVDDRVGFTGSLTVDYHSDWTWWVDGKKAKISEMVYADCGGLYMMVGPKNFFQALLDPVTQ